MKANIDFGAFLIGLGLGMFGMGAEALLFKAVKPSRTIVSIEERSDVGGELTSKPSLLDLLTTIGTAKSGTRFVVTREIQAVNDDEGGTLALPVGSHIQILSANVQTVSVVAQIGASLHSATIFVRDYPGLATAAAFELSDKIGKLPSPPPYSPAHGGADPVLHFGAPCPIGPGIVVGGFGSGEPMCALDSLYDGPAPKPATAPLPNYLNCNPPLPCHFGPDPVPSLYGSGMVTPSLHEFGENDCPNGSKCEGKK